MYYTKAAEKGYAQNMAFYCKKKTQGDTYFWKDSSFISGLAFLSTNQNYLSTSQKKKNRPKKRNL